MKLIASLIATAALALGMLVAVPTTATAAPYPGTVATRCDYVVPGAVKRKRNLNVLYRVRARSGNAKPAGIVIFRVYKIKHHRLKFLRTIGRRYHDNKFHRVSLGSFRKKGRYATKMWFRPSQNSVYKYSSSGFRTFRVTR